MPYLPYEYLRQDRLQVSVHSGVYPQGTIHPAQWLQRFNCGSTGKQVFDPSDQYV